MFKFVFLTTFLFGILANASYGEELADREQSVLSEPRDERDQKDIETALIECLTQVQVFQAELNALIQIERDINARTLE